MKNDTFDEMFDLENELKTESYDNKKLNRKLNFQINKRIFRSILLFVLVIAVVIAAFSEGLNLFYYNPSTLSDENVQEDDYKVTEFDFLMDMYLGLNYPDYAYTSSYDSVRKNGFGSYDVTVSVQDSFYPVTVGGPGNITFKIKRNKLDLKTAPDHFNFAKKVGIFYHEYDKDLVELPEEAVSLASILEVTDKMTEEIQKLPDSCILKVALSFDDSQSMNDTFSFMNKYPDSDFFWIPVESNRMYVLDTFDGIPLHTITGYELTDEAKESYPSLILVDNNFTADELAQCYLSRIKLLDDHPEFLKLAGSFFGQYPASAYKENPDKQITKPEDVKAVGVYGNLPKNDLLTMIESGDIHYVSIQDVKLSSFSQH